MHYHLVQTHRALDETITESWVFHDEDWNLARAIRRASDWVSWEGLASAEREAQIRQEPDPEDPDCPVKTIAYMWRRSE